MMKYVVIVGDGMADEPIPSLGGKTPLEYAKTPHMDSAAQKGLQPHTTATLHAPAVDRGNVD